MKRRKVLKMKKQKMITKEIAKQLPSIDVIYDSETKDEDLKGYIHYFHIYSNTDWYIMAGDRVIVDENRCWRYPEEGEEPNDWRFFARVFSHIVPDGEFGTLYLSDFDDYTKVFGEYMPVEREYGWKPLSIKDCKPY